MLLSRPHQEWQAKQQWTMFSDVEHAWKLAKQWERRQRERNGEGKCLEVAGSMESSMIERDTYEKISLI